jgi:hypothetical protein
MSPPALERCAAPPTPRGLPPDADSRPSRADSPSSLPSPSTNADSRPPDPAPSPPNAEGPSPDAASSSLSSSFNDQLAAIKLRALNHLLLICNDAESSPVEIRRAAAAILRCPPFPIPRPPATPATPAPPSSPRNPGAHNLPDADNNNNDQPLIRPNRAVESRLKPDDPRPVFARLLNHPRIRYTPVPRGSTTPATITLLPDSPENASEPQVVSVDARVPRYQQDPAMHVKRNARDLPLAPINQPIPILPPHFKELHAAFPVLHECHGPLPVGYAHLPGRDDISDICGLASLAKWNFFLNATDDFLRPRNDDGSEIVEQDPPPEPDQPTPDERYILAQHIEFTRPIPISASPAPPRPTDPAAHHLHPP